MVEDTATFAQVNTLLKLVSPCSALRSKPPGYPGSLSASNERRPIVPCMMPALSTRNCTWPALAFFTAVATSGVTVPTFGLGIRPRGPGSGPGTHHAHGIGSCNHHIKRHVASLDLSRPRSSMPTTSAPAALASSALAPWANTATRVGFPVPLGMHDGATHHLVGFLGIHPELHRHVDGLIEFGGCALLHQRQGFSNGIQTVGINLALQAFAFWSVWPFTPLHSYAHQTGRAGDGANGSIQIGGRQVFHLWSWRFPRPARG